MRSLALQLDNCRTVILRKSVGISEQSLVLIFCNCDVGPICGTFCQHVITNLNCAPMAVFQLCLTFVLLTRLLDASEFMQQSLYSSLFLDTKM